MTNITKQAARTQLSQAGTSTPTKRYTAWEILLKQAGNKQESKPGGYKLPTQVNLTEEWSTADWKGDELDYNQIWLALAAHGDLGTITALGGSPAAYGWTAQIQPDTLDAPQAVVLSHGNSWGARQAADHLVAEVGTTFGRDKCEMKASSIGAALKIDQAGGTNLDALIPMTLGVNTRFQSALTGTDATTTFTYSTLSPLPAGTTSPLTLAASDQSAAIQAALEVILGAGNVAVMQTANHTYLIELIGRWGQKVYTVSHFTGAATSGSSPTNTITRPQTGVVPTFIAQKPILSTQWWVRLSKISYADLLLASGLGDAVQMVEISTGGKWENYFAANTDSTLGVTDPTGQVENEVSPKITLSLYWHNAQAPASIRSLRRGDIIFLQVTAQGALISGSNYLKLVTTMCCQVADVIDIGPLGKVWGAKIPLTLIVSQDADFLGKSIVWDGITTLASL